jgi:hypothetical protein
MVGASLVAGVAPAAGADTPPALVPGLAAVVEGDTATTTVEVPVTLSEPTNETVTVDWQTIYGPGVNPPNPATPGDDFTAANGTITIAPGDTTATAAIEIKGDTIEEPDEYIVVAFTNVTNARPGGFLGLGFAIIEDDDAPPLIEPGTARIVEGDTGTTTLALPVTLSEPTNETVTVDWQTVVADTSCAGLPISRFCATPDVDYVAAAGTITFPPGQTTSYAPVQIIGDAIEEEDEGLYVRLDNATNARLDSSRRYPYGVIEDDDGPPPRTISLVPSPPVDGGDTVTVVGSGWTPGAEIGLCQGVDDPSLIANPGSGCFAGTGSPSFTVADQDGNFSAPLVIYRWGYVGAIDLMLDCTQAVPGCVVGAAEIADLIPTATVMPLSFSTPPPPPMTRGEVGVLPSTDLTDGQSVTIAGSGFRPNQVIDLNQCAVVPVFTGPSGCEWGTRALTATDGAGTFSTTFTVSRQAAGVDCTTRTCYLVASEAVDFVGTYVASPIGFAPPP